MTEGGGLAPKHTRRNQDNKPQSVEQQYTRLASHRFHYDGLTSGFSVAFDIDDEGLVRDYPGVFSRLP